MEPAARPKVLCVDDEPAVLDALTRILRKRFDVSGAASGPAGLEVARRTPDLAVILSDLRMPGMDGSDFLGACRAVVPDATRMLFTGLGEFEAAVAAINQGQVFRFLTKPCPPLELIAAIEAGVAQHRLVTAEKVLLEQTLHGAIKVLTDVLAQVQPAAFGRALRIKRHAAGLAQALGIAARWQVEVAAMVSQLGVVCLPPEQAGALDGGASPASEPDSTAAKMAEFTDQVLGNLPRLEGVRAILTLSCRPPSGWPALLAPEVAAGARILRAAADYERAESEGASPAQALGALRARGDLYDERVLRALAALLGADEVPVLRRLPVREMRPGMVLSEDMHTAAGVLLAARGYQISETFLARLANFRPGMVREPVLVATGETALPIPVGERAQAV